MVIKINYEKCCWKDGKCSSCDCGGACEGCVEACPNDALKRGKLVDVDESKCTDCGLCIAACEHNAISLK